MAHEVHMKRSADGKSTHMKFVKITPDDVAAQVELSTSEPISTDVPSPEPAPKPGAKKK